MRDFLLFIFLSIPLIGAFVIFALGISVIYRASRVLNLAHGAMAMVPAYVAYSLVRARVPMLFALPLAVFTGAGLGVGVERVFVRRLRAQGPTAQTVGTVAVAGLLIALAAKVWGTTPVLAPHVFPGGELRIAGAAIRYADIGVFVVGALVATCLFAFFKLTDAGLAMRGSAENRRAAALMGINPDLAAGAAWALGGGLAALAGVLLASVTNLDPYNLSLQVLPAFVAVLIGGLESPAGAVTGAAIAGLAFGLGPLLGRLPLVGGLLRQSGAPQFLLTLLALVVMAMRGGRLSAADSGESGLTGGRAFRSLGVRRITPGVAAVIGLLAILPWLVPFSVLGDALLAMELTLVAFSLVLLIGWVGQISLAQASFVGMGALVTGIFSRGWGLGFPLNVVFGAAAAAAIAVILGVAALRVRGLYLAVATLIFAWMADQFLFRSAWLGASGGSSTIPAQQIGAPGGVLSLDLTSRRTLYFVILAVLVLVMAALANLRDTRIGRAFFALRGSEMAAASLGIDVVRYKLVAFALSGLIAGIAGGMLMVEQRTVVPAQFLFTVSLQYLAIAVVGGLSSLGGAVAAGVVFAGLNELFFRVSALAGWLEVVSAGLLALVLLVYPGGLAAVPDGVRRLLPWARGLRHRLRELARQREPIVGSTAATPQVATTTADLGAWTETTLSHDIVKRTAITRVIASVVGHTRQLVERSRPALRRAAPFIGRAAGAIGRAAAPAIARLPRMRPATPAGLPSEADDWFESVRVRPGVQKNNGSSPRDPASDTAQREPAVEEMHDGQPPAQELRLGVFQVADWSLPPDRASRRPLVEAEGVVVRFGGLTAVSEASLAVREGEIVGLIGPNGAGKTTFFNAILGLNSPAAGRINIYGHDVTGLPPHIRARLGVARTFQVLQIFSELTVFDNLLVATHLRNRSSLISNLAASPRTLAAEAEARKRVRDVLSFLSLERIAHESVRGLPFGVLRMVELGRALVTGARIMMLDEPASGLNEAETDRLAEVIRGVRQLGVSVLLIEHDVRMVVGISDHVYVLDRGSLIAEGPPLDIQRHPAVIAAYLGGSAPESTSVAT